MYCNKIQYKRKWVSFNWDKWWLYQIGFYCSISLVWLLVEMFYDERFSNFFNIEAALLAMGEIIETTIGVVFLREYVSESIFSFASHWHRLSFCCFHSRFYLLFYHHLVPYLQVCLENIFGDIIPSLFSWFLDFWWIFCLFSETIGRGQWATSIIIPVEPDTLDVLVFEYYLCLVICIVFVLSADFRLIFIALLSFFFIRKEQCFRSYLWAK